MVSAKNIKKEYGAFQLNCSIEIPKGCVIGLIGRNGAGKSTTIKAILGLIKITDGELTVFGKSPKELSILEKQQIGVALAESGFSTYLTLADISRILKRMYTEFDMDTFQSLCQSQQLPMNQKLQTFSTGMKAKAKVLIALSHKAQLLILDEPTAGLDVTARNEILDMIRTYLEEDENRSLLISSHISTDLEGLCDEIYMIHNGEVILHEDIDTILSEFGLIKVREDEYENLDKEYLMTSQKTKFGYVCLTKEKQYYIDNYPKLVVENGGIDDLIVMLGQ